MGDSGGLQQAKLVLLGDMGAGKSSLVLRFVKGQFFDYQVKHLGLCVFTFYGNTVLFLDAIILQADLKRPSRPTGVNDRGRFSYKDYARTECEV